MKKAFEETGNNYTVKPLEPKHWKAFKEFYTDLGKTEFFVYFFDQNGFNTREEEKTAPPEIWKALIEKYNNTHIMFGLWDGKKLIGQTAIKIKEEKNKTQAVFTLMQIADDYQKLGLTGYLYNAKNKYLLDIGFTGPKIGYVKTSNKASLKAAQRNGFVIDKKESDKSYYTLIDKGHCSLKDRPSYIPNI